MNNVKLKNILITLVGLIILFFIFKILFATLKAAFSLVVPVGIIAGIYFGYQYFHNRGSKI